MGSILQLRLCSHTIHRLMRKPAIVPCFPGRFGIREDYEKRLVKAVGTIVRPQNGVGGTLCRVAMRRLNSCRCRNPKAIRVQVPILRGQEDRICQVAYERGRFNSRSEVGQVSTPYEGQPNQNSNDPPCAWPVISQWLPTEPVLVANSVPRLLSKVRLGTLSVGHQALAMIRKLLSLNERR